MRSAIPFTLLDKAKRRIHCECLRAISAFLNQKTGGEPAPDQQDGQLFSLAKQTKEKPRQRKRLRGNVLN
jgi:hypothetical protein